MATYINKYGWPLVKAVAPDEAWHYYEQYYMVDENTPDIKYMCFTDDDQRVIWRETKDNSGITTLEFGWGAWDDRTSLTYVPINGMLLVS